MKKYVIIGNSILLEENGECKKISYSEEVQIAKGVLERIDKEEFIKREFNDKFIYYQKIKAPFMPGYTFTGVTKKVNGQNFYLMKKPISKISDNVILYYYVEVDEKGKILKRNVCKG